LLCTLAVVGTAGAFTPQPKTPLTKAVDKNVASSHVDVRPGAPLTKAEMVAIRSPFWNAFGGQQPAEVPGAKIDYVVDRDYTVALTLILVGIWLTMFHPSDSLFIDWLGGAFHLWFGSFIGMQTMRTRVVFNKDTFELKTVTNKVLGLEKDKGLKAKEYKNYVLGTNNEWRYDSFVNWDFFPSVYLPILIYFKETQTPEDMQIKGSIGPHQMDRRDNGQMHWFPAYANVRQIREQFEAHGCNKIGPVNGEEFKRT
jgi:NIMA (never in mitosis gene a)-related kinase